MPNLFLNAFKKIMFLPGDWHTGMNMLQSIYKLFREDLLKPNRDLLKWKKISKDICQCYFQALRLVQYSNDVVSSYLIRLYLHCYLSRYDTMITNDGQMSNVICNIAIGFDEFLVQSMASSNKHLKLIVNFLLVLSDFLSFVEAYRLQDSISV